MAIKIQMRRDTSSNWTSVNPTPHDGEVCIETNTGKIKVGNGSTAWTSLAYVVDNNFTTTLKNKLDAIEASADVTDATNVAAAGALMDSEVTNLADVKAFDTTDYATSAQGTTADAALPKTGGAMTGAITTNSTFDGRDVATDGTKLDGIEANATADQTDAEIRAAVEAATDSNVFTDADHTKLDGVEASADVTDTTNVVAALSAGTGVSISAGGEIAVTAVALTTVQTAADQTAHLALTAQEGDVVVRSDENKSYVHNGGSAGDMTDYTLLATPTDAVLSVAGNTGAVTAAQIKTAYEGEADTNAFTDADHTKLDGIEASATADQTDAEIRAAVEAATDSNVFTDADHTKLNGIEENATADQTGAEIKALYEAEANAFTDADHTKLDGIETSADVTDATNVAAAGALMDSEVTNLAQVKAFDSSDYATAAQGTTADAALPKAGGTMTGNLTVTGITETVSTTGGGFTPNLSNGTVFVLSAAGTVTMPTAAAGRSFTVVVNTGTHVTWGGSISWNGGAEPAKGAGIDTYVFVCANGSTWLGAQSGTGYA